MPSDAPKLVYPLASTALIFGVLQIPVSVYLAVRGQPLGVVTACGAWVITLHAIRTLSTRISETEVSQLAWRGRIHLKWADVTRVKRSPLSVALQGNKKRVVVPVQVFDDTRATIDYIDAHLPSHIDRV